MKFTLNLDKVKIKIGQLHKHDGSRTKKMCRLQIEWLSKYVVGVKAHE